MQNTFSNMCARELQGIPTMPSRSLSQIQIGGNVGRDENRGRREKDRNSRPVAAKGETFRELNESSCVSDSVENTSS